VVVPVAVVVESVLDAGPRQSAEDDPPPELEGSESAFHLAVQVGSTDAAFDVMNLPPVQ